MPEFPRDHNLYEEWAKKKRDNYREAVAWINQTRSALLQTAGIASVDVAEALSKGKLLLYEPEETVTDGASEAVSHGFFDIEDSPPWDTWFHLASGSIFSYVPESAISLVQHGIDVNIVDCIQWTTLSEIAGREA
jgi:hypothetical protein